MDDTARQFHEVVFERDFLKVHGDAFQDFFSNIMEKRHPGDFCRVRPWGKRGDEKNDGYRVSTDTLFQCYAPNDMTEADAVNKIATDFEGAKKHWPHMKEWIFVHNSRLGLGPGVLKALQELRRANPDLVLEPWGFEELRKQVFALSLDDRNSLLGTALLTRDVLAVGFEDLRIVIDAIHLQPALGDYDVRPVPPNKIAFNKLSPDVGHLLDLGMRRYDLVDRYFANHPNPQLGDEIGAAFKTQYSQLRAMGSVPDEIFFDLQSFVGGAARGTPAREAAALATLSYFFQQCDIFERPAEAS